MCYGQKVSMVRVQKTVVEAREAYPMTSDSRDRCHINVLYETGRYQLLEYFASFRRAILLKNIRSAHVDSQHLAGTIRKSELHSPHSPEEKIIKSGLPNFSTRGLTTESNLCSMVKPISGSSSPWNQVV